MLYSHSFDTGIGPVAVVVDEDGALLRLDFLGDHTLDSYPPFTGEPFRSMVADADRCGEATRQLTEYFAGNRREFDLELRPQGTEFQQEVWQQLRRIPWGRTISYGELAKRLFVPGGARAVGAANGRNPIPVIVPCHRVIAADGSLGGYSGGLERKRFLLQLEGAQTPELL